MSDRSWPGSALSGDAVIATDAEGRVTFLNPAAQQLTGWQEDAALGRPLESIFPIALPVPGWLHDGAGVLPVEEAVLPSKDGRTISVSGSLAPMRGRDGATLGAVLVFRDLTARRRAAEERLNLASIVEFSDDAIISEGLDGTILSWNAAAERIFGYSASEMIGAKSDCLLAPGQPDDRPRILQRVARGDCVRHFETVRRRKDGELIDIELTASPIRDPEGRIVGASKISRDVSERKRVYAQLLRSQKLESMSVLAGGIAHDFNNLLMGIIANATLMLDEAPPESPMADLGNNILDATEHAAHLTRQMLAYSGRGQFAVRALSLSKQIEGLCPLIRASVAKGVELHLKLAQDLPLIEADAGQIRQVVMNLAMNGAEAIGGEGALTISTSLREIGEDRHPGNLAGAPLPPGRYVTLEVEDTGSGMNPATQAKMFDPFFTTKFTGRGLGLAAVLGIVRGHRGGIAVSSELGMGTRFQVYFPVERAHKHIPEAGIRAFV